MKSQLGLGVLIVFTSVLHGSPAAAAESFEFISEHLPETAMDNRYAGLPLAMRSTSKGRLLFQAGFSSTTSSRLHLSGSQISLGYHFPFRKHSGLEFIGFVDTLAFSGGDVTLPFDVLFTNEISLSLPASADYGRLKGNMVHWGIGAFVDRDMSLPWMGRVHASYGVIAELLRLEDYRIDYRISSGDSTGASGFADYSATYRFLTPMLQLSRSKKYGDWRVTPKMTIALPLPRAGVAGRITGPGFDISGNTAKNGKGKHYGDFSLTLGLVTTYQPWHLSVDLGSLLTQALLEPVIHKGIEKNLILTFSWGF